ncbi:hypothetical protein D3C85_1049500 [compost metagenome]
MGYQAGVGAVGQQCGGGVLARLAQGQDAFPQGLVAALGQGPLGIGIAAGPGLYASIQVEHIALATELQQRQAGDIHREIQQEVPGIQQRRQLVAVVRRVQGHAAELHPLRFGKGLTAWVGTQDNHAARSQVDMTADQRKHALADAAEAEHYQAALETLEQLRAGHGWRYLSWLGEPVP